MSQSIQNRYAKPYTKQDFSVASNVVTKEYFFCDEHNTYDLGKDWVPCSFSLPMRVAPRPSLPSGQVETIEQYKMIFHDDEKEVTLQDKLQCFFIPVNKVMQVTERQFLAEASDVGLRPGEWPKKLVAGITLFELRDLNEQRGYYVSRYKTLEILND